MSEKAPQFKSNPNGDVKHKLSASNANLFRTVDPSTGKENGIIKQDDVLDHYGYADRKSEQLAVDYMNESFNDSDLTTEQHARLQAVAARQLASGGKLDVDVLGESSGPEEASEFATTLFSINEEINASHDHTLRDHGYADRATEEARLTAAEERKALNDKASDAKSRSSGNSFAAFEADAEAAVKQTQDDRYNAMGEDHMDLRLTKEISAEKAQRLNDQVQIMIWGSGDRKVTIGTQEYTPDQPFPGRLETFRNAPGGTYKERHDKANSYEADVLELVENQGYELCQAKLIMDLREEEVLADFGGGEALTDGLKTHMLKQFMRSGASMQEAKQRVAERYEGMTNEDVLKEVIKNKAILDEEELEAVLGMTSDEVTEPAEPSPETPEEPTEETPEEDPRRQELIDNVGAARNRYAEMLALGSSTLTDKSEDEREQARNDWLNATQAIINYGIQLGEPHLANLNDDDRNTMVSSMATEGMTNELYLLKQCEFAHAVAIGEAGPGGDNLRGRFLRLWGHSSREMLSQDGEQADGNPTNNPENDNTSAARRRSRFMRMAGVTLVKVATTTGITKGTTMLLGSSNPITSILAGSASFGLRSNAKRYDVLSQKATRDGLAVYEDFVRRSQDGEIDSMADVANVVEDRNASRRRINKWRMAGSLAVGAGLGLGVSEVANKLFGGGESSAPDSTSSATLQTPEVAAPETVTLQTPEVAAPETATLQTPEVAAPEVAPTEGFFDTVGNGEGITHTVQDLIRDRLGVVATPEQLGELYFMNESALDQIQNVVEMPNVIGGDGFAAPGVETYIPPELVDKLLSDFQSLR